MTRSIQDGTFALLRVRPLPTGELWQTTCAPRKPAWSVARGDLFSKLRKL